MLNPSVLLSENNSFYVWYLILKAHGKLLRICAIPTMASSWLYDRMNQTGGTWLLLCLALTEWVIHMIQQITWYRFCWWWSNKMMLWNTYTFLYNKNKNRVHYATLKSITLVIGNIELDHNTIVFVTVFPKYAARTSAPSQYKYRFSRV